MWSCQQLRLETGQVKPLTKIVCSAIVEIVLWSYIELALAPISSTNFRTFYGIPFHAILRCYLTKVCLDDSSILSSCEKSLISCNSQVLLPLCAKLCINTVRSTSAVTSSTSWRGICWCASRCSGCSGWSSCCCCRISRSSRLTILSVFKYTQSTIPEFYLRGSWETLRVPLTEKISIIYWCCRPSGSLTCCRRKYILKHK